MDVEPGVENVKRAVKIYIVEVDSERLSGGFLLGGQMVKK